MESTAPQLTVPEPADRGSDAMRVKNRKAVRRLSVRSFRAAGKRSVTAAVSYTHLDVYKRQELMGAFNIIFYSSAEDAVFKALGVE